MATGRPPREPCCDFVDATKGIPFTRTRRHCVPFAGHCSGIRNVLAGGEQDDLVEYRADVFLDVEAGFSANLAEENSASPMLGCVPIRALEGDKRRRAERWNAVLVSGPTLLEHLEKQFLSAQGDLPRKSALPVKWWIRPHAEFADLQAGVASGLNPPVTMFFPSLALPIRTVNTMRLRL